MAPPSPSVKVVQALPQATVPSTAKHQSSAQPLIVLEGSKKLAVINAEGSSASQDSARDGLPRSQLTSEDAPLGDGWSSFKRRGISTIQLAIKQNITKAAVQPVSDVAPECLMPTMGMPCPSSSSTTLAQSASAGTQLTSGQSLTPGVGVSNVQLRAQDSPTSTARSSNPPEADPPFDKLSHALQRLQIHQQQQQIQEQQNLLAALLQQQESSHAAESLAVNFPQTLHRMGGSNVPSGESGLSSSESAWDGLSYPYRSGTRPITDPFIAGGLSATHALTNTARNPLSLDSALFSAGAGHSPLIPLGLSALDWQLFEQQQQQWQQQQQLEMMAANNQVVALVQSMQSAQHLQLPHQALTVEAAAMAAGMNLIQADSLSTMYQHVNPSQDSDCITTSQRAVITNQGSLHNAHHMPVSQRGSMHTGQNALLHHQTQVQRQHHGPYSAHQASVDQNDLLLATLAAGGTIRPISDLPGISQGQAASSSQWVPPPPPPPLKGHQNTPLPPSDPPIGPASFPELACEICHVQCNSAINLEQHLQSKKHITKAAR